MKAYVHWYDRDAEDEDVYSWCKRLLVMGGSVALVGLAAVTAIVIAAWMVFGTACGMVDIIKEKGEQNESMVTDSADAS